MKSVSLSNINTLSLLSPNPSRDHAHPRARRAHAREGVVKDLRDRFDRYFPPNGAGEGRGNSRADRQSLFFLSGNSLATPTHTEVHP